MYEDAADSRIICYRRPIPGKTLDEWPVIVELIDVEEVAYSIETPAGSIGLIKARTLTNEPIILEVKQGPSDMISVMAELWEPPSGWLSVVTEWTLTLN